MRKQILGCAAVLSLAGGGSDVMASADDPARPPCCYTNPRYAGTCAVEPAKDETCASVLAT